jgi:hypothetical protein
VSNPVFISRAEFVRKYGWQGWKLAYGVPRKLKCAGCQLGEHCNGEDDGCYCECTEAADHVP